MFFPCRRLVQAGLQHDPHIGGRKRQIESEAQSNLEECLLESGVTDAKAVKIWNKARKGLGKEEVSNNAVRRIQ